MVWIVLLPNVLLLHNTSLYPSSFWYYNSTMLPVLPHYAKATYCRLLLWQQLMSTIYVFIIITPIAHQRSPALYRNGQVLMPPSCSVPMWEMPQEVGVLNCHPLPHYGQRYPEKSMTLAWKWRWTQLGKLSANPPTGQNAFFRGSELFIVCLPQVHSGIPAAEATLSSSAHDF